MHSLRMSLARGARSDFGSASEALAARVPPGAAMRPLMTAVGAAAGAAAGSTAGSGVRDGTLGAQSVEIEPEPAAVPVMAAAKSFFASLSAAAQRHSTLCAAARPPSMSASALLTPGRGGNRSQPPGRGRRYGRQRGCSVGMDDVGPPAGSGGTQAQPGVCDRCVTARCRPSVPAPDPVAPPPPGCAQASVSSACPPTPRRRIGSTPWPTCTWVRARRRPRRRRLALTLAPPLRLLCRVLQQSVRHCPQLRPHVHVWRLCQAVHQVSGVCNRHLAPPSRTRVQQHRLSSA